MTAQAEFNIFAFPFVDEPVNVDGSKSIGRGARRIAYLMEKGFVRKTTRDNTADYYAEYNRFEAYKFAEFGSEPIVFTHNRVVYRIRLAKVLQCASDYSWIDMEYITAPLWNNCDEVDCKGMEFHLLCGPIDYANRDYITDGRSCIECEFSNNARIQFGITDMHGYNFAYDSSKREFIIFDYGMGRM